MTKGHCRMSGRFLLPSVEPNAISCGAVPHAEVVLDRLIRFNKEDILEKMYKDLTIIPLLYNRPYPHSVYDMEDTGIIVKRYNTTFPDGESMPYHRQWWIALRRWTATEACEFSTNVQRYVNRRSADDYTVITRGDSPYECTWSTFHPCMLDTSPFRSLLDWTQVFSAWSCGEQA
ncbi:hypothetical protein Pelo_18278 [Pelomyxa schiedti]|nr:hypothetical protein Pelo_18278 [Pelomyxa schiedti]